MRALCPIWMMTEASVGIGCLVRRTAVDSLLKEARLQRDKLKLELQALDQFILNYERAQGVGVQPSENVDLFSGAMTRKGKAGLVEKHLEIARNAMINANRPLNRREIYDAVVQAGLDVVGGDKLKVLGTNVWRSGKFKRVARQGYWPADIQLPEKYLHLACK